ncbi:MAG TPA: pyridoxamine 5'-phosphate oxidase family protein [Streptosporangiaceae bacterium]|nr:pyridoxamine 5'-phosphate oxidase family protein [Streptosporangiaceae bacterium]
MTTPVTTLDTRYSSPGATAVSWDETRAALDAAQLFWLSTVRADGRPHVTPVVAVWADGVVCFSTGEEEQKFINLRANPRVVVTTGCNAWDEGLDVVVEGTAVQVTEPDALKRFAAAFATKWDGRWQFKAGNGCFTSPDGDGQAMVFAVQPVKVFAHAKGDPFGATRHKF